MDIDNDINELCSQIKFSSIIKERDSTEETDFLLEKSKETYYLLVNGKDMSSTYINQIDELFKLYKVYISSIDLNSKRSQLRIDLILNLICYQDEWFFLLDKLKSVLETFNAIFLLFLVLFFIGFYF